MKASDRQTLRLKRLLDLAVRRFTKDMIEEHNLEALLEHRVFDYRWAEAGVQP